VVRKSTLHFVVLALLLSSLGGCMRGSTSPRAPIHPNPNMDIQPKYRAQAASSFFYDGATMRPQVAHTVARGELRADTALWEGVDAEGSFVTANPLAIDAEIMARGVERYQIYCTPCHGDNGKGRGALYDRAGVEAGNLHEPRIVDMSAGQLFDVITNGVGLMAGYRYPIPPEDRWAIIAYVRQLQSEQAE